MKTLAQFKKDIQVLDKVVCVSFFEAKFLGEGKYDKLTKVQVPEKLAKMRYVATKNTTGFYLKDIGDDTMSRGSFLGYPKASELQYSGDIFNISDKTKDGTVFQVRSYQIVRDSDDIECEHIRQNGKYFTGDCPFGCLDTKVETKSEYCDECMATPCGQQ